MSNVSRTNRLGLLTITAAGLLLAVGAATGCDGGAVADEGDAQTQKVADTAATTKAPAPAPVAKAASADADHADDDGLSPLERLRAASEAKREREREERLALSKLRQKENDAVLTSTGSAPTLSQVEGTDAAAPVDAEIAFDTRSVDLGRLLNDDPVDVEFVFTNTGTDPLVITDVRASCGCTALNKQAIINKPFQAGEGGTITARYTPPSAGASTKFVTVLTNAGEPVRLELSAEYVPPAKLERQRVALGMAGVDDPHTADTFVAMRDPAARIADVTFAEGGIFDWAVEEATSEDEAYPARRRLVFTTAERPRTGAFHERATVTVAYTDDQTGEEKTIDMLFTLIGSLQSKLQLGSSPAAQFIRIPTVAAGEPFTFEETISHADGVEFSVEDVVLESPVGPVENLSVRTETVEDQPATHRIVIEGETPAGTTARFGGLLKVVTDLDNEGPLTLRVSGAIRDMPQQSTSE